MTPRELEALEFVRERLAARGVSPSYREIEAELGLKSLSGVQRIVNALVSRGELVRHRNRARGLTLGNVPDLRVVPTDALHAELARRGETPGAFTQPVRRAASRQDVPCACDCCSIVVEPGSAFCREHWYAIDKTLRDEMLGAHAAYRRLQSRENEARYQTAFFAAREQANAFGRVAA